MTRDVLAELDLTLALAGARTPADLELAPFGDHGTRGADAEVIATGWSP